jgi:hypothetical protein
VCDFRKNCADGSDEALCGKFNDRFRNQIFLTMV